MPMREVNIDLWDFECDVRCITTNGTVTSDGRNIMGGGCAGEASERYPRIPYMHGTSIQLHGVHCYLFGPLVMFPTKRHIDKRASFTLIKQSAYELNKLISIYRWQNVALPRPGCGLGGLRWEDVRPVLHDILDPSVTIIDYAKEVAP